MPRVPGRARRRRHCATLPRQASATTWSQPGLLQATPWAPSAGCRIYLRGRDQHGSATQLHRWRAHMREVLSGPEWLPCSPKQVRRHTANTRRCARSAKFNTSRHPRPRLEEGRPRPLGHLPATGCSRTTTDLGQPPGLASIAPYASTACRRPAIRPRAHPRSGLLYRTRCSPPATAAGTRLDGCAAPRDPTGIPARAARRDHAEEPRRRSRGERRGRAAHNLEQLPVYPEGPEFRWRPAGRSGR